MSGSMQNEKPKLAVIGTGLAGLSAAWLLRDRFDVMVYEGQPSAGMGVYTINFSSRGINSRIDIPLRIFCKGYYQEMMALYEHIGVEVVSSDHAGAFADAKGKILFHYGNMTLAGLDFSYLKGRSILSPSAWKVALQARRFFKHAARDAENRDDLDGLTFEQYLAERDVGKAFTSTILLPMMSVTCTCDYQSVLNYPADIMLGYLTSGVQQFGILGAKKGVDDIVPRLLEGVRVKTSTAVAQIKPDGNSLAVVSAHGDTQVFDHVVVAAQAQQAAAMLQGFDAQRQRLETVSFEESYMSVHTDENMVPGADGAASPVSYIIPDDTDRPEVTVNLTRTNQRLAAQDMVFQTWNPIRDPDPAKELARVKFTRPIVTMESRLAMRELRNFHDQKDNRLWFCGSYVSDKIPLLDAAVESSIAVAERLGAIIPWKTDLAP